MTSSPEVALLVSTYQRPWHLQRTLHSIAMQRGVRDKFEVVVTDDGSEDETRDLVESFARRVRFPVRFTTHSHQTFQLARCRNEGVAASRAPYLMFVDGDCLLPPDYVRSYLRFRKPNAALTGDCVRLSEVDSQRVDEAMIRSGRFVQLASTSQLRRLRWKFVKDTYYYLARQEDKPRIMGGTAGIWRSDFERINGCDEAFEGWGYEDFDLGIRLRAAGVRIQSILHRTFPYHLWHPTEPTKARLNRGYHHRRGRLTRCMNGLVKRQLSDLSIRVRTGPETPNLGEWLPAGFQYVRDNRKRTDIEIAFYPGAIAFSQKVDCRVLVACGAGRPTSQLLRQADYVVSNQRLPTLREGRRFSLTQLEDVLRTVASRQRSDTGTLQPNRSAA